MERRYFGATHNGIIACAALAFVLLGLSGFAAATSENARPLVIGTMTLAVFLPMGVRALIAGVLPDDSGVLVRELIRSRRFAWSDIRKFGSERGQGILPWRVLTIELTNGKVLRLGEVASMPNPANREDSVEFMAEALNRRLERSVRKAAQPDESLPR